jgi:predicted amidohydrolase
MLVEIVNFKSSKDYHYNLERVKNIVSNSPADFLLFPEVCLTGFDYENWQDVNEFAKVAINELSKLSKPFALTIIEENKNYFYFFDNGIVHKRAKYNLFCKEKEYFKIGSKPDIFEWNNFKIANLICFELRFLEYWEKFKGVDLILVPARWGKERINHFKTLNKALSLSTQAQVLAVNSANEEKWGCSFDAWGDGVEVSEEFAIAKIDFAKNKKIRKKLNIGIK